MDCFYSNLVKCDQMLLSMNNNLIVLIATVIYKKIDQCFFHITKFILVINSNLNVRNQYLFLNGIGERLNPKFFNTTCHGVYLFKT